MPSSISPRASHEREATANFALLSGLLAGPLIFLTLLEVNYVLSYVSCETRQTWFLHLSTAIAIVLVAGAGFWAWTKRVEPASRTEACDPVGPDTRSRRVHWMAVAAALVTAGFLIAIVALAVPALVLRPCQ